MPQMTVVCPHCGSTGTYTHGFPTGSGSTRPLCETCHKMFTIEIRNGQVYEVKRMAFPSEGMLATPGRTASASVHTR